MGDEGENRSGHAAADGGPTCPVKESPEKGGLARASACNGDQESCGQAGGTSATGVGLEECHVYGSTPASRPLPALSPRASPPEKELRKRHE